MDQEWIIEMQLKFLNDGYAIIMNVSLRHYVQVHQINTSICVIDVWIFDLPNRDIWFDH